jgi:proteasome lid subunit RPN8/RPN11
MTDNNEEGFELELAPAVEGGGGSASKLPAPEHCEAIGQPEAARAQVYLDASVWDQIVACLSQDLSNELGGVLVGTSHEKRGRWHIHVTGMIAAEGADSRRASLTFTHEAWNHIYEVLEADYPDQKVVGWVHSHPGFGIFLSGHDLFIQNNFFNMPSQVALVYDPRAKEQGFFANTDSGAELLPGYHLVHEGLAPEAVQPASQPASRLALWAPWALLLAGCALLLALTTRAQRLETELADTKIKLYASQAELAKVPPPAAAGVQTEPAPTAVQPPAEAAYQIYQVAPSDTLSSIAEQKLGARERWVELARLNGIVNPDRLLPGRLLILPASGEQPAGT